MHSASKDRRVAIQDTSRRINRSSAAADEVMNETLADDDRDAILTHVALYWSVDIEAWQLLTLGRSQSEIEDEVAYWKGKGTDHIRVYELASQEHTGGKD